MSIYDDGPRGRQIESRSWWIILGIAFVALLAVMAHAPRAEPTGHDPSSPSHWYPLECCHHMDCAPVDRTTQVGAELVVTSQHGTVTIPQSMLEKPRQSKDGKAHVCIRAGKPVCYFLPPSI